MRKILKGKKKEADVESVRKQELERLEKLLDYWYEAATAFRWDVLKKKKSCSQKVAEAFEKAMKAVPLVLRMMERKAEMLGLNFSEEISSEKTEEESLKELAAQIKAKEAELYDFNGTGYSQDEIFNKDKSSSTL